MALGRITLTLAHGLLHHQVRGGSTCSSASNARLDRAQAISQMDQLEACVKWLVSPQHSLFPGGRLCVSVYVCVCLCVSNVWPSSYDNHLESDRPIYANCVTHPLRAMLFHRTEWECGRPWFLTSCLSYSISHSLPPSLTFPAFSFSHLLRTASGNINIDQAKANSINTLVAILVLTCRRGHLASDNTAESEREVQRLAHSGLIGSP